VQDLEGVRAAMRDVEGALPSAAMDVSGDAIARALRASMERLLDALRLALTPPTRACPHCGAMGMLAATRCGACWCSLTPSAPSRPALDGAP
jgi:hypothetical protein